MAKLTPRQLQKAPDIVGAALAIAVSDVQDSLSCLYNIHGHISEFVDSFRMVFEDKKLTIIIGKKMAKATIALDPTRKPKHIDMLKDGINSPAIYDVGKDSLRVVIDEKDKTRAKGFVTEKGSFHMSFVLKRLKE